MSLTEHLRDILMGCTILRQLNVKCIELRLEFHTFVGWRHWRLERPRLETLVPESPVEPNAQLPSKPKSQQRGAMVAAETMVCVIACFAHLRKQGCNFAWHDALVLQAA